MTDPRARVPKAPKAPPWMLLHGVRAARATAARLVVGCLLVSAVALGVGTRSGSTNGVVAACIATLAAPALVALSRALIARKVVVDGGGWLLVPVVGAPRRMPPVRDAFTSGDDVVVCDAAGGITSLGLDAPTSVAFTTRAGLVRRLLGRADPSSMSPPPKEHSG